MNTIAAEMGPGFQVFHQKVFDRLTSKNDSHLENQRKKKLDKLVAA